MAPDDPRAPGTRTEHSFEDRKALVIRAQRLLLAHNLGPFVIMAQIDQDLESVIAVPVGAEDEWLKAIDATRCDLEALKRRRRS